MVEFDPAVKTAVKFHHAVNTAVEFDQFIAIYQFTFPSIHRYDQFKNGINMPLTLTI
jgi:hypothetical protein